MFSCLKVYELLVSGASRARSRSQISNYSAEGSQVLESSAEDFSLGVTLKPLNERKSVNNGPIEISEGREYEEMINKLSGASDAAENEADYRESFTSGLFYCLEIFLHNFSVCLDARLSAFASFAAHSSFSGKLLIEGLNDADGQDCSNECYEFISGLFKTDWMSLDCDKLSEGRFTSIICAIIMNKEHSVCESALSVLRRQYGKCPSHGLTVIVISSYGNG